MSGTCNRYGHYSQMFKCSLSLLGNVIFNMHTNMNFQELIKGKCLRLVNLLKYISLTVFCICDALLGNLSFSIILHNALECLLLGAHWSMKSIWLSQQVTDVYITQKSMSALLAPAFYLWPHS